MSWGFPAQRKKYLHFARIDRVEHFDGLEGILFFSYTGYIVGFDYLGLFR